MGFLFVRKERWGLTWRARLLILALTAGLAFVARNQAYSFLAVNEPAPAELLVVEGWLLSNNADLAAAEFKRGHYRRLLIIDVDYTNYRTLTDKEPKPDPSGLLAKNGIPRESFSIVRFPAVEKDRTYHGARAAKEWLAQNDDANAIFNVATIGPHARRSRLLFQKAFGRSDGIGIVAITDPMYDSAYWWRYSEGIRDVVEEGLAYGYALYFSWFA